VRLIVGKRAIFTHDFLSESQDLDEDFRNILCSLLSGMPMKQLHMILDTAGRENGPSVIRWVPFHLSFILSTVANADAFSYTLIASHMSFATIFAIPEDFQEMVGRAFFSLPFG